MNSPSEPKPDADLLTSGDVANLLKVSLYSVREMTRSGRLPCLRFSAKTIRYLRSDIEALLLAMKEEPR